MGTTCMEILGMSNVIQTTSEPPTPNLAEIIPVGLGSGQGLATLSRPAGVAGFFSGGMTESLRSSIL